MEHLETLKIPAQSKKENLADLPELAPEDIEMREITEPSFDGYSEASLEHPDRNEDAFFIDKKIGAAGLFDGMGGHKAGNIASEMAAGTVLEKLENIHEDALIETIEKQMVDILNGASAEIISAAKDDFENHGGMGTTATVLKIIRGKAIIANVGDSRAYLWRDKKLTQLTKDDSFVQELVERKMLPQNADQDVNQKIPQKIIDDYLAKINIYKKIYEKQGYLEIGDIRNAITQNLGAPEIEPRVTTIDLKKGDIILLCSDGISDNELDEEIADIMGAEKTEKDIAKKLADKAAEIERDKTNPRGKPDDKTAIIIKI